MILGDDTHIIHGFFSDSEVIIRLLQYQQNKHEQYKSFAYITESYWIGGLVSWRKYAGF